MKVKAAVAIALTIVLLTFPVAAKPGSTRVVTIEYQGPNTLADDEDTFISHIGPMARPRPAERSVQVVVEDISSRPVSAELHQGDRELTGRFCGETADRAKLHGRRALHVHLYTEAGCDGQSAPTQGTITFIFHE